MADAPSSPGQKIFQEHMGFLMSRNLQGLLENQYAPDAVLISPFDVVPGKSPPHIIKAGPEMIDFFTKWLDYHGQMNLDSLYDFAELDDTVFFQAIITSQKGKWVLGEAWHMNGSGKIDRHYGFAHQIDPDARP